MRVGYEENGEGDNLKMSWIMHGTEPQNNQLKTVNKENNRTEVNLGLPHSPKAKLIIFVKDDTIMF